MKKICSSAELYKALEAANLLQYIQNIQGEDQKQPDGVFLPICEPIIKPNVDAATALAIQTVFDTQVARDWRTIISTRKAQEEEAIVDSKNDGLVAQASGLDKLAYDAFWNGLTAAQKDRILKRLFREYVRNRG